jgi:parallel beta-helix repeat protein
VLYLPRFIALGIFALTLAVVPFPSSFTPTAFAAFAAAPTDTYTAGGRVSIKDTNYPIPSGAFFVATNGSDSNPGTQATPWRTIQKAVSAAPSGSTIVIRQGTYRESVTLGGKALTLQPYPHEQVWLKGSVIVPDWVRDGAIWRKDGWTYAFQQNSAPPEYIDPAYPLAAYPDMVFVNGKPLVQVVSKANVSAGKFYVDYTQAKLYIGDDPNAQSVSAAALQQALRIINASGTVVRGLGFMHYATQVNQQAAVKGDSTGLTFENNTFAWNAAGGLTVLGTDAIVRGNTFVFNGQIGLLGHQADRLVIEQNTAAYNNQEHFKWAGSGVKITTSRDTIWRDNLAEHNLAKGLWVDVSSYNATIVRNVVRDNDLAGIQFEVSARAIIASNVVVRNGLHGIYISESEDVDVYNNTLVANKVNIRVFEGNRTSTTNPLITHNVRDIIIKNNILSNVSDPTQSLFSVDDVQKRKTGEQMGVSANFNAYYRTNTLAPKTLVQWSHWPTKILMLKSLVEFRAATGRENNGLAIENVAVNPFFLDEANRDYRLKAGSVAIGAGAPLSQRIANAIGVPAGVPVNLGALKW